MNIKKIKPLFTAVVVTADIYPRDYKEGGLISPKANKLKEYQKVIAVGESSRGVAENDIVCIDLSQYAQRKYKKDSIKSELEELHNEIIGYNVPQIVVDNKNCLYLDIRDIKFVVTEFEDKENEEHKIITPSKSIIL